MEKRPSLVSRHRQSIRPSTRFKRLPVWVSKADIVAYLKLGLCKRIGPYIVFKRSELERFVGSRRRLYS